MKKLTLLLLVLPFSTMCFAQEKKTVKSVRTTTTTKMTTTPVAFEATSVVPEKTTILVYNDKGTLMRKATSGTKVGGKGVVDCAQIPCPSTFAPGTVCWKCVERTVMAK